jgi:hypothetical protein
VSAGAPDRGLQNERTELAWQRSALSVLVLALLLLRSPEGAPGGVAPPGARGVGGVGARRGLAPAPRYAVRHRVILATGTAGPDRHVLITTVAATTLGLTALAMILVG